jgi:putative transposase
MVDLFKNRFRISSARLQNWDYGRIASYFITICTYKKRCYFGNILNSSNDSMLRVSKIGKIVEQEWLRTLEIRPDMNLKIGPFVVMPNHFHSILFIGENKYNERYNISIKTRYNSFFPQSKNLASIIRGFKSSVTKRARIINADFGWQPRFHDHIIRDEKSYNIISEYVMKNPLKWLDDKYYNSETIINDM